MNCCFSSGHICRICNADYTSVCKDHLLYSECNETYKTELLTKDSYDKLADLAVEEGASLQTRSIKGHCVFNELESFHCVDQLPPCIGHDFYEVGVNLI